MVLRHTDKVLSLAYGKKKFSIEGKILLREMRKTCDLYLAELTVLGCDTREIFCCVIVGGVFLSREEEQEVCDSFCANGTWSMLRSLFLSGR